MTDRKKAPLDYAVKIPAIIKLDAPMKYDSCLEPERCSAPFEDNIFYRLFLYDDIEAIEGEEAETYTLADILNNFESFVKLIARITQSMRESNFDVEECALLLDHYYGCDWADWDIYPNVCNNYYYVQTTPELRAIELAMYVLQLPSFWNMDVTEVRERVDVLKKELWQCLPDFYKGHEKPMLQPFSYIKDNPYPYAYITDDFVEGLRPLNPVDTWAWGCDNYIHLLPDNLAATERPTTLSFEKDDLDFILKTNTGMSIWLCMDTYDTPFADFMGFIEDIASNNDPSYFDIDPEGPRYHILCDKSDDPRYVKFLVHRDSQEYEQPQEFYGIRGIFKRQPLILRLIELCDSMYKSSRELTQEQSDDLARRIDRLRRIV